MAGARRVVITAGRVVAPRGDLVPGVVEIEEDRIVAVRRGTARHANVAAPDGILAPGLIDLQINGAAGADFLSCRDEAQITRVRRYLATTGCTSYLLTLISSPWDRLRAALARWQRFASLPGGPRVLGVHVEGPFLNAAFRGAHDPRYLRVPDVREYGALLDEFPALVKVGTLAPELLGADAVIHVLRGGGCVVSAGHTGATYDEACRAFAAGVQMVTHLFNAMRGMHHRDPGIAAAALEDPHVAVGLIADFVHVHPTMVRLAIRLKGSKHVALVTDAIAAAGAPRKATRLGGRLVKVTDAPRLTTGTLVGSVLALDQAVWNVVSPGVPVREAVLMASAVPARILGRSDLGRIAPGALADLVLFDGMKALRLQTANILLRIHHSKNRREEAQHHGVYRVRCP